MLVFVFSGLVVLLDQFFKRWIVLTMEMGEQMDLIPGVIGLMRWQNPGAAFGILAGHRWLLAGIAFVACIILVCILLRYTEGFWGTLGLGAVLGGAVGNLVDRVWPGGDGYVVDMFQTLFISFPIFNIADIFITLGFITFCVHFIITSVKQAREEKEDLVYDDDDQYSDDYGEEYSQYGDYGNDLDPQEDNQESHYTEDSVSAAQSDPFFDEFSDASNNNYAPIDAEPDLDEIAQYMPEAQNQDSFIDSGYQVPLETVPVQESVTHETPAPTSWQEYYEPTANAKNETNTLDALSSLEAELISGCDYDIDALLSEYGFEATNETDK